jgi:hypothetical protein
MTNYAAFSMMGILVHHMMEVQDEKKHRLTLDIF